MRKPNAIPRDKALCVTIESVGAHGDGIGYSTGRRVFVPYTAPGDRVQVMVVGATKDGLVGRPTRWDNTGPDRQDPSCAYFGCCGGCALQHLSEEAYARWKVDRVQTAVTRAGADPALVEPLLSIAPGKRRRARLVARRSGAGVHLGFQKARSHAVVAINHCPVLHPDFTTLLPFFEHHLEAVLPDRAQADILLARLDGGDLDLVLIGPDRLEMRAREALAELAEAADLARLSWRPQDRAPLEPVAHRRPVSLTFGRHRVSPPPGVFMQPTTEGEQHLVDFVLTACADPERVADLYAGCGSFALRLVDHGPPARQVLAFEGESDAVASLRGVSSRVEVIQRDLARDPIDSKTLRRFDAVVLDPPRAGAAAQTAALAVAGVPRVVLVSCNPATWARDARSLLSAGYRLSRLRPLDQFLWSPHIEIASLFEAGAC